MNNATDYLWLSPIYLFLLAIAVHFLRKIIASRKAAWLITRGWNVSQYFGGAAYSHTTECSKEGVLFSQSWRCEAESGFPSRPIHQAYSYERRHGNADPEIGKLRRKQRKLLNQAKRLRSRLSDEEFNLQFPPIKEEILNLESMLDEMLKFRAS